LERDGETGGRQGSWRSNGLKAAKVKQNGCKFKYCKKVKTKIKQRIKNQTNKVK
jgi:hypothetical protein